MHPAVAEFCRLNGLSPQAENLVALIFAALAEGHNHDDNQCGGTPRPADDAAKKDKACLSRGAPDGA